MVTPLSPSDMMYHPYRCIETTDGTYMGVWDPQGPPLEQGEGN